MQIYTAVLIKYKYPLSYRHWVFFFDFINLSYCEYKFFGYAVSYRMVYTLCFSVAFLEI
jgi:hypothetical protein